MFVGSKDALLLADDESYNGGDGRVAMVILCQYIEVGMQNI